MERLYKGLMGLAMMTGVALANTAPTPVIVSCAMREGTTLMDITYRVDDPDDAVVSAWPLVFVDGTRSFANAIRPVTFAEGTENNFGTNVLANTNYQLVWNVGADWDTDLGQVKFEIICKDSRGLLPLEWLALPATATTAALTISKNVCEAGNTLDALFYLYAARDSGLVLSNGVLYGSANSGVFSGIGLVDGLTTKIYSAPYLLKAMNVQPALDDQTSFAVSARSGITVSDTLWHAVNQPYGIKSLVLAFGMDSALYGPIQPPVGVANSLAVSSEYSHSLALRRDGTVAAWGRNTSGQCSVPAGLTNVIAVRAGRDYSLALRKDGTVVAWGGNSYGQCTVPSGLTNVAAIGAGYYHGLAVTNGGQVVAWGYNSQGQCNVPAGLTGAIAVAGGMYHSLALKGDGTVVAWGQNVATYKQCDIPAGLSGVTAIAAGQYHSLALKNDGAVVAWGYNGSGQCNVPAGLSNVVAVAAGVNHSLALKSDGTVVAWGSNSSGQCAIPSGLSKVTAISGGYIHTLVVVQEPTAE